MADTAHLETAEHARPFEEHEPGAHAHPGYGEYVRVALVLAVLTAIEVALYYLEIEKYAMIASLSVLMSGKFYLVAAFFMHLKFDSKLYTSFFLGGIVATLAALVAVLATFRIF